jgi:hypothetical protein
MDSDIEVREFCIFNTNHYIHTDCYLNIYRGEMQFLSITRKETVGLRHRNVVSEGKIEINKKTIHIREKERERKKEKVFFRATRP